MSFIITPKSTGRKGPFGGELERMTSEQERAQELALRSLKELPKSRYATKLAITQIPSGRGRKAVFSHIEVYKMVETIANELRETGVRPGTVCAMVLPNCVEAIVYFLALQWIGAIAAPIECNLDTEEMERVLKAVEAFTVVSPQIDEDDRDDDELYQKVSGACASLGLIHWGIFRSTNKGVELEQNGKRAGEGAAWSGGAADFVLDPSEISVHMRSLQQHQTFSDAASKVQIVPLSHSNLSNAARSFASEYELSHEKGKNTMAMTTQMSSIHGLVPLIATIYSGGHVVVPGSGVELTPTEFCKIARDHKVTWISADAAFIDDLHAEVDENPDSLKGVELAFVRCHEGNLSPRSKEAFDSTCSTSLYESYGLTETGGMISTNRAGDCTSGTSGKAIDGAKLAIFDPKTRKMLPVGASGDVAVASSTNSLGYLGSTDDDENHVVVDNEDGTKTTYLLTGRRGKLNGDGFLLVEGVSSELRRAELAAEEEIRSADEAALAIEREKARVAEEALRKKKEEEEEEERQRIERERSLAKSTTSVDESMDTSETETDAAGDSSDMVESSDGGHVARGFSMGRSSHQDADPEAMSQILERLMSIEANQKKLVDDMKTAHEAEVSKLKELLEETEKANKLAQDKNDVQPAPSVIQVNMDEMNAAVNAATIAAQNSSRHTAEAAEAAKRAAKHAEDAASRPVEMPKEINQNSSQVEIKDPSNVQKTIVVSLDEIEQAMMTHSAVSVCRAFGRPDERYGNEVFCCVLPRKGARVSEPWLKLHAQSVLPAASVPKKFYYREDLKEDTTRAELADDKNLKRVAHASGYSSTKMIRSPQWNMDDNKKAAA